MKTKHFIATLILSILLPVAAMAETFIADGVTYTYTVGESGATITSVDDDEPTLVIRKSFEVDGATYTVGKLSNGSVFRNSKATKVIWKGPWTEPDLTGAQFYNFANVEQYAVEEANPDPSGNKGTLEVYDGVLYSKFSINENHLLAYPCKKTGTSYAVRENTIIIMTSAFRNNKNLTSIDLNPQVQIIRNEAFSSTISLTTINAFPNTAYPETTRNHYVLRRNTSTLEVEQYVNAGDYFETVGGVLFQKNTRTGSESFDVNFPEDITFQKTLVAYPIGKEGDSYAIPNDTKVLGRSCFYRSNLKTITAPDDLIEIREYAFAQCKNLTTFKIPRDVQYINLRYKDSPINPTGYGVDRGRGTYTKTGTVLYAAEAMGAFDYCDNLVLSIDENNPYFKVVNTYDGSTLLSNVLMSKDGKRLVRYGCTTDFPGYMVPRDVEYIDSYAFNNTKLAHVVLPSKLTYISRNLFENAENLEFITIPPLVGDLKDENNQNITSIYQDAFKGCSALKEVFMMPETPPMLASSSVFGNSDYKMYVKPDKTINSPNNLFVNTEKTIYTDYTSAPNYPHAKIETDIPVTLNAYGLASMCRDFAVELDGDLQAYYIPDENPISIDESDQLAITTTNLTSTATSNASARFIPARTGDDYGDYRGVILKTVEDYDPNKQYKYQISVEDFANTYNLRGKNQISNTYTASYTFPDKALTSTTQNNSVSETTCSVNYSRIGWSTQEEGSSQYKLRDDKYYYHKLMDNASSSITIKLKSGDFQAGDVFKATMYSGGTHTDGFYFKSRSENSNSKTITYNASTENELSYTLKAEDINSDGSLTIYRYGTNCYIRKIEVTTTQPQNTTPRTIRSSRYILGTPVETNITVKTTNDQSQECTTFGLKGDKFQRTAADGIVKANKAYLCLPNDNVPGKVPGVDTPSTAKFTMVFKDFSDESTDSETTGIHYMDANIEKSVSDGNVYNMQGSRVGDASTLRQGSLPKGLYILNGKKYVVK